jgi:hypothetical protein
MAFTTRHETAPARQRTFGTADGTLANRDPKGMASFAPGLRAIAEASLVAALGLPVAVLLIGTLIALLVRTLHEGLSWLTRSGDVTGPFIEGLVAVASAVGGVLLFALSAQFFVRLFWQRRAGRDGMKSSDSTSEKLLSRHLAEAIS